MPSDTQVQLLVMLAVGAVATSIIEALGSRDGLSRLFAHLLGAIVIVVILYWRGAGRPLFVGPLLRFLSTGTPLLFIGISTFVPSVLEAILGPDPILAFLCHLGGPYLALLLVD